MKTRKRYKTKHSNKNIIVKLLKKKKTETTAPTTEQNEMKE